MKLTEVLNEQILDKRMLLQFQQAIIDAGFDAKLTLDSSYEPPAHVFKVSIPNRKEPVNVVFGDEVIQYPIKPKRGVSGRLTFQLYNFKLFGIENATKVVIFSLTELAK